MKPIKNDEERSEKKTNSKNGFNVSIINPKNMITNFKHGIRKSKRKYKKYKVIFNIKEAIDIFLLFAATFFCITIFETSFGLMVFQFATGLLVD